MIATTRDPGVAPGGALPALARSDGRLRRSEPLATDHGPPPSPADRTRVAGPGPRLRIAFVGNAPPRRCGIATFTDDLQRAVAASGDVGETAIFAMRDPGGIYAWPASVRFAIDQDDAAAYRTAADAINRGGFDVVCLQHEFGIFGGLAGQYVLGLIAALKVPLITTMHTVLDRPDAAQRLVVEAILAASFRVVVMANKGRDILIDSYGVDPDRVVIIPHGIPDARFESSDRAKRKLGLAGRKVILTFGLIGPNKGIEAMIEALPAIVAAAPDALYVLMGATHPHLLRHAGEAYRDALVARVRELGLENHVMFINRFVDRPDLLEQIAACDIYVTPYPCVSQLTSGALAYSHGQGRAVVSTPYWHAAELLADGSGVLVPFGDPAALGRAVAALLADEQLRQAMAYHAYAASRPTVWAQTAARYVDCFLGARRQYRMGQPVPCEPAIVAQLPARTPRNCYA